MSLQPYASPIERIWFWVFRIFCGLILLFLMVPVLVIIPLSRFLVQALGWTH